MNSNDNINISENFSEEEEQNNTLSLDEFFEQLEAKEKDLDISSDVIIEIDGGDFGAGDDSEYFADATPAAAQIPPLFVPSTPAPDSSSDTAETESQIKTLKNRISRIETERGELIKTMRRRQTDFDNYKKRTERERGEIFNSQIGNLAKEMLPVMDNLNRALDSGAVLTGEKNDFKQFYDGIFLVNQQLNDVLAEMGIQPIDSVGEVFDPNFHEAVAIEETAEHPPQTIVSELLRGYKIGNKVIRAAMVKVSAAPKAER